MEYKKAHSFEDRLEESHRIREKFPGRVPCIVERAPTSKDVPLIDKAKFLVPGDLRVNQFIYIIRKRLVLPSEKALFLFAGNTLPTTSTTMRELYSQHAEHDGFLYFVYSGENTFG